MDKLRSCFRAFFLTATAILCSAVVLVGAMTAEARTERMLCGQDYAVAVFATESERLEISEENGSVQIKIPAEKLWQRLRKLLPFTPAGAVFSFFESAFGQDVFSG